MYPLDVANSFAILSADQSELVDFGNSGIVIGSPALPLISIDFGGTDWNRSDFPLKLLVEMDSVVDFAIFLSSARSLMDSCWRTVAALFRIFRKSSEIAWNALSKIACLSSS